MKKRRFLSFTIDFALITFLTLFSQISFLDGMGVILGSKASHLDILTTTFMVNLGTFIFIAYFTLCFHFNGGRTLGQKALHLITMKASYWTDYQGNQYVPDLKESLRRSMGLALSVLFMGIPFLSNLKNKRGSGLVDWYSQTSVITENEWYELFLKHQESAILQLSEESFETFKEAA